MKHRAFVAAVRDLARVGWGRQYGSAEEACRALLGGGVDLAGASLLELVRRLNVVIDALARDSAALQEEEEQEDRERRPTNAKAFPAKAVGDTLFACDDLEDGVQPYLVLGKDAEGFVRIIAVEPGRYDSVCWATEDLYETEGEALVAEARKDLSYHGPRVAYARKVLEAVERGTDLAEFRDRASLD